METFQFESFVLDRSAYELRCDGQVVRLERMPMELLLLLVERHGQLVTRQDILDRLYGREVFGDADNSINIAIRKIRQALKDRTDEPRFLHTIPGKGYRFVIPAASEVPASVVTAEPESVINQPIKHLIRRWLWVPFLLVMVAALAGGYKIWIHNLDLQPKKIMLAVLPFENYSADPSQEYFVDGMTEELIAQLGGLDPEHLGVIARTSVTQYKGAKKDVSQIGRDLGVGYYIESSVRLIDGRVRVTSQLIQVSDQTHLWVESFERDQRDTLKIQSDIARTIAEKIGLKLSQQSQALLANTPSVNPEAHQALLQGFQSWNLQTRDDYERAITDFNRAIELDPKYAAAYTGLARVYVLAPVFNVSTPEIAMPKAREAATHALALDNRLAEAHSALGFVSAHFDHDWPTAERELLLSLSLNPSYAQGHLFYSNSYLSPLGRHDAAIAEAKKAIDLDPFSIVFQSFLGRTYVLSRRYDDALAQYQKVARIAPGFALNHERLAHLYEYLGNFEDAITEESTARRLFGDDPHAVTIWSTTLRNALTTEGKDGYWQALLKLSSSSPSLPESYANTFGIAIIYAQLGDKDMAMTWIEKAFEEHSLEMSGMDNQPSFDSLRNEPRFQAIRKRMGLASYSPR